MEKYWEKTCFYSEAFLIGSRIRWKESLLEKGEEGKGKKKDEKKTSVLKFKSKGASVEPVKHGSLDRRGQDARPSIR